jgi:membrane associated rhomboid family serine protease
MDKEFKRILRSFIVPFILVSVLWLVKFAEWQLDRQFIQLGVLPRTFSGLIGIITSPLIHGNLQHLISNSLPLLVLGGVLNYFYRDLSLRVFLGVYFLSGIWLWLGGRDSYHIGASGVVYGLTAFLFFSGMFRRDTRLMALSMLVVFLYGGMVWGIFPLFHAISWEAHLFGAFAGLLFAFVYRKEGPQRKIYEWEKNDDDVPDDENAYWRIPEPNQSPKKEKPDVNIKYIYKSAPEPDSPPDQNDKN